MANPSLKAQIEAAKSALASRESTSSLNTEADQIIRKPTTEQTTTPPSDPRKPTNGKTFESVSAEIDARITNLETKLLANQKDLHQLLIKIRKITNLHGDTQQKSSRSENTTLALGFRRHINKITISLLAFICLVSGATYFLTKEQYGIQLPLWIKQLGELTSVWIG